MGALTRFVPFELVDSVLEGLGRRTVVRRVPSRVAVYFVLALVLFPGLGYGQVWDKLIGAVRQLGGGVELLSRTSLGGLRRRLGPVPFKELFEVVAGPLGGRRTVGVFYRGLRTVAFDGCRSTRVPESAANLAWLGKHRLRGDAQASYPLLHLMALMETGTRAVLGAVLGATRGEVGMALELMDRVKEGMPLLADRGFDSNEFIRAVHAGGAALLLRACATRRPVVLKILHDGSYLSVIAGVPVRIIEARTTVTCADGSTHRGDYRLITTLLDARRHPAGELVTLYHQRWEIEVAFLALRHTMVGGQVLRSQDPQGLRQEMWALLTVYQVIRTAMADATDAISGCDPDRACFTVALNTARDSLITATDILPAPGCELTSTITLAVSENLLDPRRPRISARTVKSASSRYNWRPVDEDRPQVSTPVTRIDTAIHPPRAALLIPRATTAPAPAPEHHAPPRPRPQIPLPPPAPPHTTRLQDLRALMATAPERHWRLGELNALLRLEPVNGLGRQLLTWSQRGILTRTGHGTYALPEGPPITSRRSLRPEDVLTVMATEPERHWRPRELAEVMGTFKESTLAQVMSTWSHKGLLTKTAPAVHTLPGKPTTRHASEPRNATKHHKPTRSISSAPPSTRRIEHQIIQAA
ncbi:IS4 family transposase [Streptomyces sp. KMM 9044]|uniref:IS4 family transposase n=1 Tax=Streptomyces sp. KMM 9044 TaxID=2744474 RepID=UPI0022B24BEA|nr:IS4 family transposase [Streptomyces sp. KMM 9044]WAX78209.1 IS4 family transposase [Streptomyces sp. KMM 9044]